MDVRSWVDGGSRLPIALTMAVALLSLATGVINIGFDVTVGRDVLGPLAALVPPAVRRTAEFTGTLTGFLLLASALGLRRGLRAAWYATMLLLPLTALQGVVQQSALSLPLVALSAAAWPVVALGRGRFGRRTDLTAAQLAALGAIVGTQVYGTAGTYALREEFDAVETVLDAAYYTLVTISTVGYGDALPRSQVARLFSMSLIVVGTASFGIALGTLLTPMLETRVRRTLGRMTRSELDLLENHVVVLGHGDLTESIVDELDGGDVAFVVVMPTGDRAAELTEQGYSVLTGDPTDEEPMQRAGLDDARAVVVATEDDAADALAVLTARELEPEVPIVAAASDADNVEKLRRAGATTVISPSRIGGRLLAQSALGRRGMESLADRVIREAGEDRAEDGSDAA